MGKKLIVPTFVSEAEDAAWHQRHKRQLEEEMARRIAKGKTLTLAQAMSNARARKNLQPVTIRLAAEDIDTARELAVEKGIGYQTYIRMLLREALHRRVLKQTRSTRE